MINTIILMGRLTKDIELNVGGSSTEYAKFSVAIERRYVKQGEERQTDFINCTAFGKTAAFINQYFHKGNMIGIVGSLQSNKYIDKDGNNRTSFDVMVSEASFCGGKNTTETEQTQAAPNGFADAVNDSDVPF